MTITLDITAVLTALLLIVAIVAIIVIIVQVLKLSKSMQPLNDTIAKTNQILEDVSVITQNAKEGTVEARIAVQNISGAVNDLSQTVKSNRGTIAAMSNIINAGNSLAGLFKNTDDTQNKKRTK